MEKIRYVLWCEKSTSSWGVEANRGTLATILAFIAEATAAPQLNLNPEDDPGKKDIN
jgi:hypothetical protein